MRSGDDAGERAVSRTLGKAAAAATQERRLRRTIDCGRVANGRGNPPPTPACSTRVCRRNGISRRTSGNPGSDWPVVNLAGGYARWFAATGELLHLDAAQRRAVLGGNAARVYGVDRITGQ